MECGSGDENKAGRDLSCKAHQEAAAVPPRGPAGAPRLHSPAVPSRAGVKSGAMDQLDVSRDREKRRRSVLFCVLVYFHPTYKPLKKVDRPPLGCS